MNEPGSVPAFNN